MKDLFKSISDLSAQMLSDMSRNINDGNKAAGARARKASLELAKLCKEYRKRSVPTASNDEAE